MGTKFCLDLRNESTSWRTKGGLTSVRQCRSSHASRVDSVVEVVHCASLQHGKEKATCVSGQHDVNKVGPWSLEQKLPLSPN